MQRFFMTRGPWINWQASLDDVNKRNVNTVRWGAPEKNRHGKLDLGNKGNWDTLQLGDRVYFANQLSDLGPFSKQVIFGFGDVVDKFEQKQPYWPDEKKTNQVIYKYVFDVKPTFMTLNDNGAVEWIRGLPRTKGFSPIKDKDMIKKLEVAFGQRGAKPTSTFKFVEEDFKCERTKKIQNIVVGDSVTLLTPLFQNSVLVSMRSRTTWVYQCSPEKENTVILARISPGTRPQNILTTHGWEYTLSNHHQILHQTSLILDFHQEIRCNSRYPSIQQTLFGLVSILVGGMV